MDLPHLIERLVHVDGDDDLGALGHKSFGDREADASTGAGDDGGLASNLGLMVCLFPRCPDQLGRSVTTAIPSPPRHMVSRANRLWCHCIGLAQWALGTPEPGALERSWLRLLAGVDAVGRHLSPKRASSTSPIPYQEVGY